jgi:periplasmic copper chaperone A
MTAIQTNPTRRALRGVAALCLALGLVAATAACSSDDDTASTTTSTTAAEVTTTTVAAAEGVTASGAWARQSPMMASAGAAYMTLTGGATADELVSASVPAEIAGTVELHETSMSDEGMGEMGGDMGGDMGEGMGMMSMKQIPAIPVPAGGTVELKPSGLHIMLLDLAAPLVPGEGFELTLTFASGETLVVPVEVRAA